MIQLSTLRNNTNYIWPGGRKKMNKISRNMSKAELIKYLREHQITISEFHSLLESWFNLTGGEREELIHRTGFYRMIKRSK